MILGHAQNMNPGSYKLTGNFVAKMGGGSQEWVLRSVPLDNLKLYQINRFLVQGVLTKMAEGYHRINIVWGHVYSY